MIHSASSLSLDAAAVRHHYQHVVLPLWRGAGFDAALGLPREALSLSGEPLPNERFRAMACARQLYVFSRSTAPGDDAHARRLLDSLDRVFRNREFGGWHYSVDSRARPLDRTQDLYTHAFVIFACCAYATRFDCARARDIVWAVSQAIEDAFLRADGLYDAVLDERLERPQTGPRQNPIMHLTEAYIAAHRLFASRDSDKAGAYAARLSNIARRVAETFVVAENGCVAELPLGSADNRIEPGHQFEWFSLLAMAPDLFRGASLTADAERAFAFACAHGVSRDTSGVCAALSLSGDQADATERIWAQTELLRALALRGDGKGLALALARFKRRFLRDEGWFEILDPHGAALRHDMPSTTPYHLETGYSELL